VLCDCAATARQRALAAREKLEELFCQGGQLIYKAEDIQGRRLGASLALSLVLASKDK
jgi:hypothetical protein